MSLHQPNVIAIGAARLRIPPGAFPPELWVDYAKIRLLEPEPALLSEWCRRLQARFDRRNLPPAWNILRVSPNMERKVCEALGPKSEENPHSAGLRVYVPMEKYRPRRNTWRSRTRALIPGYIFAELPDDDALDLARKNHAVRDVMCSEGRPVRVPALAIGSMILMEAWGEFDATWGAPAPVRDKRRGRRPPTAKWKKGQLVKVLEGPFASFMAEIVNAERADRIEAFVDIFGRLTPVTFDEEMLAAGEA